VAIGSLHALDPPKPTVTKSLCASRDSLCGRDVCAFILVVMDVVAIVIGIAMFAILLAIVEGIDRI